MKLGSALFLTASVWTFAAFARTVTPLGGAGWTCDGEAVSVPHTWNAADACDGPNGTTMPWNGDSAASTNSYLRKRAVYRRTLTVDPKPGRRYFLKFEGASIRADVTLNGRRVGEHVGAFTAFAFEVTGFLKAGANALEVGVDNRRDESTQPMSADFSVYGGLYRPVWLIETGRVCIDPVTDGADGVKVAADPKTGEVTVDVAVLGGTNEVRRFKVDGFELWSPENPRLYTRRIAVRQGGAEDAVDIRFGFRTFEFRGDGFYLNGKRRQLRGVNRHQDRAGKGWAVSPQDEEEDIRLVREMGADALRTAHYPQSRHIYDLCDELGLIVWLEYPNVNMLTFTEEFERGMHRQIREMVAQHRNHPSVAMWSMWNELYVVDWGKGWVLDPEKALGLTTRTRDLIHRLDPSRPVVAATDKPRMRDVNDVPDQLAYNRYPGWYSPLDMHEMLSEMFAADDRKILGMSEYGIGGSIRQHGDPTVGVRPGGPWHPEEYQAWRMHDNLLEMTRDARIWGHYVWAMFDFAADRRTEGDRHGINDKGLVTHDHKTKKDAYYLYQAAWSKVPTLHLVGSRMTSVTNDVVNVLGFSNVGDVTLLVNGRTVGRRAPDEVGGVFWSRVKLKPGENRVELTAGGRTSAATWTRKSAIPSAGLKAGCATVKEPAYDTLIAHRGESVDAPENTLPAYRTAVDRGFGFECDIYLAKDGRLFTFHDQTLARTTAGANTNRCTDVDWEGTVSKVNVGGWGKWKGSKFDPTRPALFSEVLSLARDGRYIYVEVKGDDPSWVPFIKAEVARAKNANPGNVLFITFGDRLCAELKRQMPEYRTYFLMCAYKDGRARTKPWTADEVIARLRALGADGIDIQFAPKVHDAAFVKAVKDAGFSFHVWTVDDLGKAKAAFAAGADTLTTNCAKKILDGYEGR